MEDKKYHIKYRLCLIKKHAHIVYYEDQSDKNNKHALAIMENMRLKYPKVPCDKFLWKQRKIKSIEITAETASDILCFREGKQVCKVHVFLTSKLENLFQTVYNDCVENSRISYNRYLTVNGHMKKGEKHQKYILSQPAYVIPNKYQFSDNPQNLHNFRKMTLKPELEPNEKPPKSIIHSEYISKSIIKPTKTINLSDTKMAFNQIQKHSLQSNFNKQINKSHSFIRTGINLNQIYTNRILPSNGIELRSARNQDLEKNSHVALSSILFASTNTTSSVSKYFPSGNLSSLPFIETNSQPNTGPLYRNSGVQESYLKHGIDQILKK